MATNARLRVKPMLLGILLISGTSVMPRVVAGDAAGRLVVSPEPGWPQWRGRRRDGVSDERGLLESWPKGGPKLLWQKTGLGRGYSSPVVTRGTIYVTGDVGQELRIFALDPKGKSDIRAHPVICDGRLYLRCHDTLYCYDVRAQ